MIICPMDQFIEIALKMGFSKDQITKLTNELIFAESDKFKEFKQHIKRMLDQAEFYNSPEQIQRRKKAAKGHGTRAL